MQFPEYRCHFSKNLDHECALFFSGKKCSKHNCSLESRCKFCGHYFLFLQKHLSSCLKNDEKINLKNNATVKIEGNLKTPIINPDREMRDEKTSVKIEGDLKTPIVNPDEEMGDYNSNFNLNQFLFSIRNNDSFTKYEKKLSDGGFDDLDSLLMATNEDLFKYCNIPMGHSKLIILKIKNHAKK